MEPSKKEDKTMIVAAFDDRDQAHRAVNNLEAAGFNNMEIGMIQRQPEQPVKGSDEPLEHAEPDKKGEVREPSDAAIAPDSNATKRTMTGVMAGGVVGAVAGAAAALLIPGIGPVLAGGIVTSALVGVTGGMAAGGIIGALTELGLPEAEARFYGTEFEAGRTIVTVRAGSRSDKALKILQEAGGRQATTPPDTTGNNPVHYPASS